jgi:iron complex outermembrane recepter protein
MLPSIRIRFTVLATTTSCLVLAISPIVLAQSAQGTGGEPSLPSVTIEPPKPSKPKPVSRPVSRPASRPVASRRPAPVHEATQRPSPEQRQPQDTPASSQTGSGIGGRLTGYTVSLGTPALATKDGIPILQNPANVQVVTRQTMDDQQDISVRDAVVGYVSSVQPPSVTPSSNNFYDGFNIRGFDNANIYRNDLRLFELTGIETANLQSIEILKGAHAWTVIEK